MGEISPFQDHHLEDARDGIYVLDSGYVADGVDAIFLIVSEGRVGVLDPSTRHARPRILDALQALGLGPTSVDWILLTHVHLDHAGGAGDLLQVCPHARVTVHPRGRRHLIAPEQLWRAVCQVYGEASALALYGGLTPIPEDRIQLTEEGTELRLGARQLRFWDAPGHALHHVLIEDCSTRTLFCGDSYGLAYRSLTGTHGRLCLPTSSPSQFDPDSHRATIQRVMAGPISRVMVTHYGELPDHRASGERLLKLCDRYAEIGLACQGLGEARRPEIHRQMRALFQEEAQLLGLPHSQAALDQALDMDLNLNVDGLICWLDRL